MSRLIHVRMLLALAIAVTIGALEFGSMIAPKLSAHTVQENVVEASGSIPMLSTIRVFPADEIPTLPLVIVRPINVERADASPAKVLASVVEQTAPASGSGMPHVRLDMPYYSFGKMLPNVIKD